MSAPEAKAPSSLIPLLAAALMVAAGLAALLLSSRSYVSAGPAAGEPYNLLTQGFRSGHLWLAKDAPEALLREPNPYLFSVYRRYLGAPWNLIDLSYYRGHLYTYFGPVPALVLFWPWSIATGSFLHQGAGVLVFTLCGLALSLGVAASAWRRFYASAGPWAAAFGAVLLASLSSLPVFVARPGLFEVANSCGYMFLAASVAALWRTLHGTRRQGAWLCAASVLFGLAVGSRPSVLYGAVVLVIPAAATFAAGGLRAARGWTLMACAVLPLACVGVCLAVYNAQRFGDPLQFGHDYQLSGNDVYGTPSFSLAFLWDNLQLYFLSVPRWHGGFPYVWRPPMPVLASGHIPVEFYYGVLASTPAVFAALLVPVYGFRRGPGGQATIAVAMVVLFSAIAAPLCLYAGATSRYMVDFMPPVALLSFMGLLGAEGAAPRPLVLVLRAAALYSIAVAWLLAVALVGFYRGAEEGLSYLSAGRPDLAATAFEGASRCNPDFRGQADLYLGADLLGRGRLPEAEALLRRSVAESPLLGVAHYNLGEALLERGRLNEAATAFSRAAALDPKDAEAEENLGVVLFRLGDTRGGIQHEERAVDLDPSLEVARRNLQAMRSASR